MNYISRSELIDVIVSNNMVEEFASWVKSIKSDITEPISLWDIDYELLLNFVLAKKLIELDNEPEYVRDAKTELEVEDRFKHVERKAIPRKIRRKT